MTLSTKLRGNSGSAPERSLSRLRIAIIGDSISQYNAGNPRTATSITRVNGVTTVTAANIAVWPGAVVRVNGIANPTAAQASLMGLFTVATATNNNSFTVNQPGLPDASASAGTVVNCSSMGDTGYMTWAQMLSGQRIKLTLNAGWAGQRTDEMIPRVATELAPHVDAFDELLIFAGMNDAIQGKDESTWWADTVALWDACAALGKRIRVCTVTPFDSSYAGTGGAAWSATKAAALSRINRRIRDEASARRWACLDFYAALVDPLAATPGNARAGMLVDGVHPAPLGASAMGTVYAAQLELDYPLPSVLPFGKIDTRGVDPLSANVYDGFYTASGGTVNAPATGVAPTGVIVDASVTGGSCLMSTEARADGNGFDAIATVTPGGSAGSVTIRCSGSALIARLNPAKAYRLVSACKIDSSGVAQIAGAATFEATLSATLSGASKTQGIRGTSSGVPVGLGWLVFESNPLPLNGITPTAFSFSIRVSFPANAPAFTLRAGAVGVLEMSPDSA
ncbi:SGNH/GDSL hydrolase family protein [Chitinibacteraceae bacterium HSL-7]